MLLSTNEIRRRHSLPVTSPARTLVDLASVLGASELESALARALRRGLVRQTELTTAMAAAPQNAKGIGLLRELAAAPAQAQDTRSRYERKLLALIREAELPTPIANGTVEGHMVDLLWREEKVIVEFDSITHHGDRRAFEQDRFRDQRLIAAGYRVLRVTARQINETPFAVIARITAALAHARAAA